jgi:uncharacterized repeat protein (TIGR01451 family)
MIASISTLEARSTATFTVTVGVSSTASAGSTITAVATIASETLDSNPQNNRAQATTQVSQVPTAGVTVQISGNVNPATVGQDVTYTITVANPEPIGATGVQVHVTVPSNGTIVSLGGGSRTTSGVDLNVGTLAGGSTRVFQIIVSPNTTDPITLTASLTADDGVKLGDPAVVIPTVVNPPPPQPTPAPSIVKAVRYGFHHQSTILVVTFRNDVNPNVASDAGSYSVVGTVNGTRQVVPISRAFYNTKTHQATLLVAQKVYLYDPWQLVLKGNVTELSHLARNPQWQGVPDGSLVIKMNRGSLVGRASKAPGAFQVGVTEARSERLAAAAKWGSFAAAAKHLAVRPAAVR